MLGGVSVNLAIARSITRFLGEIDDQISCPGTLLPMSVALCASGCRWQQRRQWPKRSLHAPGKTHKIAFMLKQQTAFRYLHADVPFFKKTAEADGYTNVVVQSAENDAQNQVSQAENVITQGVDAIVIQPVDFHVAAAIAQLATKANYSARLL